MASEEEETADGAVRALLRALADDFEPGPGRAFDPIDDPGFRWWFPGIVRIAMTRTPPSPEIIFDLPANRHEVLLSAEPWRAVRAFGAWCRRRGLIRHRSPGRPGPPPRPNHP